MALIGSDKREILDQDILEFKEWISEIPRILPIERLLKSNSFGRLKKFSAFWSLSSSLSSYALVSVISWCFHHGDILSINVFVIIVAGMVLKCWWLSFIHIMIINNFIFWSLSIIIINQFHILIIIYQSSSLISFILWSWSIIILFIIIILIRYIHSS